MFENNLAGRSVLIVEDEYLLARELAHQVENAGAKVLGPVPSQVFAFEALQDELPDVAVLDIRLGNADVFSLAEHLRDLHVPFIFATAFASSVPASFRDIAVIEKPVALAAVTRLLDKLLRETGSSRSGANAATSRSSTLPIEAADRDEAMRIAKIVGEKTGQKVTLLDEDMIEIAVIPSPTRN